VDLEEVVDTAVVVEVEEEVVVAEEVCLVHV
jgi:hypothetical protein